RASQARMRLSALSAHIYLSGMSRLERIAWKFVHLVPRESELVSPATTPSTSSLRTQGTHNHRRMLFERVAATGVEKQHEPVVMGPRVRGDDGESCASAKLILPVVPTCRIPSGLPKHPNQWLPFIRPASTKRGASRSSRTLEAGCDGRKVSKRDLRADERCLCGRRSRMVLAPRRWR